ncbi:hypothetical protein Poli38472_000428 [Pythium oligandrum]|uniref:Uncharacterized protein n=1 Tax=Pythium oligandrum TaxID=41045 RepID=A0A8K1CCG7_PYTOL|nr:hypothetical protein Poli38472_000428 [Pythium oligandrum]|eukprot:TMW60386.1 hypothetical protein Poli38472_000428 [Pythium oligandrum]
MKMMAPAHESDGDALRRAFQQLCGEYEEIVDDSAEITQPVDERIGLAMFKIDEATAVTELVRQEALETQDEVMEALLENCRELEDIFIRVNLMESFVNKVHATTKELEKRLDAISRVADPVFNTGSVSTLLRSLSIKRPTTEAASPEVKWEPLEFDFNTKQFVERLKRTNAEELGVSIDTHVAKAEDKAHRSD